MKFEKLNFLTNLITFTIIGLSIINEYYYIGIPMIFIYPLLIIRIRIKYFSNSKNWPYKNSIILGIIEVAIPMFIVFVLVNKGEYSIRTRYVVFIVYMLFYILKYYFLIYLEKKERSPFV